MGGMPPGYPNFPYRPPVVISGETGPFQPTNLFGNYGRNTLSNYQKIQNTVLQAGNPEAFHRLLTADIRYSQENTNSKSALIMNAFGYAQQDIQALKSPGKQGDFIDSEDLQKALGAEAAQKFLKAEDLNNDGKIDSKEHTTYILFEDHPTQLMAGTLKAFADTPNSIPGLDPAVLEEWANQFANGTNSKLDGKITAGEKAIDDKAVEWSPNFVNMTLQGMYKALDISSVIDEGMVHGASSKNPFNQNHA